MTTPNTPQNHVPPASSDASASVVVRRFLSTMEARDLSQAKSFLAEDFRMTFPGGVTFNTLEDLVAWGKHRYSSIKKTYERFDEVSGDTGRIVYCYGTLSGTLTDGTLFDNVRFIDRFTVSGGKLSDQKVWNDLAETLRSDQRGGQAQHENPI